MYYWDSKSHRLLHGVWGRAPIDIVDSWDKNK